MALILTLAIILGITSAPAATANLQQTDKFGIIETTMENGSVMRVYKRNEVEAIKAQNVVENYESTDSLRTEDILLALGLEKSAVENLFQTERNDFENSSEIVVVSSYIKTDANENITYLSESDALQEVALLEASSNEGNGTLLTRQ